MSPDSLNPNADLIVVRSNGLSSFERAVRDRGGWLLPRRNQPQELTIPELVRLKPAAAMYPYWKDMDLGFLRELPELEFLEIWHDPPDIALVAELVNIRGLQFINGWVKTFEVAASPHLRWLAMGEPPKGKARERLYDEQCHSLRYFEVVVYPFADLWPLVRAFPNLEHLSIGRSPKLVSLDGISELTSLRSLNLFYDSKLENLEPLTTLGSLEALDMESVRAATDLDSIRQVESLQFLRIDVPKVASIKPLTGHPNLRMLICYAAVGDKDPSPLDTMPSLEGYRGWLWKLMPEDSPLLVNAREGTIMKEAAVAFHG